MNCPVCGAEAKLFAEVKPNGLIGCLCWECKKGYVTRDPEKGWEESRLKISMEAKKDLKSIFGLDVEKELRNLFEYEFRVLVTGDWRLFNTETESR